MTTPAQLERLGEHLRKLRLLNSSERLEALLQEAAANDLPYAEFLEQVLGEEVAAKASKNITMRTAMARFPFVKPLGTFDFAYQPSIDSKLVQQLASCHFIEHGDNVIGPSKVPQEDRGDNPPDTEGSHKRARAGMTSPCRKISETLLRRLFGAALASFNRRFGAVDQLDKGHRRVVTNAEAHLQDAGVATRPGLIPWPQFVEQLRDDVPVAKAVEGQAAVCDGRLLRQRDQRLDNASQFLRLGQRGLDRLMLEQ